LPNVKSNCAGHLLFATIDKTLPYQLKNRIVDPELPPFVANMIVLDTSEILEEKHFYVLDDHLNRSGHQVMAGAVAEAIERIEEREGSNGNGMDNDKKRILDREHRRTVRNRQVDEGKRQFF
jgi:hypothetical protein